MEFFWEFMVTLAPNDFQEEGYFEGYLQYIEDRCQVRVEGKNSDMVDFVPPLLDGDDLADGQDTMPLNGEATTHDGDDDEATAKEASNDEDPSI